MDSIELLKALEKCGHFLYHRRGGKRGQRRLMMILTERGECSQSDLLEILNIRAASLSELAAKLEEKGFILRERDSVDKRKVIIRLTDEGREWFEKRERETREQEKDMFDCLGEDEKDELLRLVNKLLINWEGRFDKELFRHRKHDRHRRGERTE